MGQTASKCTSTVRLEGKVAVITGANTGIGKETAKDFYIRGARVLLACRNQERAQNAIQDIQKQCQRYNRVGRMVAVTLDLSDMMSIRACAAAILRSEKEIHILVNNAGVMMCPAGRTKDGFETQMGTNYFGHYLFTMLLMPRLLPTVHCRIINVSSIAHMRTTLRMDDLNWTKRRYSALGAYQESKLAQILFTSELARVLQDYGHTNVHVYCLHPGIISTELGRHLSALRTPGISLGWRVLKHFAKTPQQGAQTTIYCAVDEKCANETGLYYAECQVATPGRGARNRAHARELFKKTWPIVHLTDNYNPFVAE